MSIQVTQAPEYTILDSTLLSLANDESIQDVQEVLSNFIYYRDRTLPYLNRDDITKLDIANLIALFDHTIMLANGRESNFVHVHYKAIFKQLAYQVGFFIKRIMPNTPYAKYVKGKMEWLSTEDVTVETRLLQNFFNHTIRIVDSPPPVIDTTLTNEIIFWDIDEVFFVLADVTEIGGKFKEFVDNTVIG